MCVCVPWSCDMISSYVVNHYGSNDVCVFVCECVDVLV